MPVLQRSVALWRHVTHVSGFFFAHSNLKKTTTNAGGNITKLPCKLTIDKSQLKGVEMEHNRHVKWCLSCLNTLKVSHIVSFLDSFFVSIFNPIKALKYSYPCLFFLIASTRGAYIRVCCSFTKLMLQTSYAIKTIPKFLQVPKYTKHRLNTLQRINSPVNNIVSHKTAQKRRRSQFTIKTHTNIGNHTMKRCNFFFFV